MRFGSGWVLALPSLVISVPAAAQAGANTNAAGSSQLVVVSTGSSSVPADGGSLTLSFTALGPTQEEADRKLSAKVDAVTGELRRLGVAPVAIVPATGGRMGFVGNEAYEEMPQEMQAALASQPRSVSATLLIKFRDTSLLNRAFEMLDANPAVTKVTRSFSLDDKRPARRLAIANALATARSDAAAYSEALDMQIGRIVSVKNQLSSSDASSFTATVEDMLTPRARNDSNVLTKVEVAVEFELTDQRP